jgi:hypothetical protein
MMMRRWLLAALMAVGTVLSLAPAITPAEAFNGRAIHRGYFLNQQDDQGGFVMRNGLHPNGATNAAKAQDFINEVLKALNGPVEQDQTGAEFIILTMMGRPPGTGKAQAHNAALLADWEARVKYYAAQGWVDWSNPSGGTVENTFWQGKNGGGPDPNDVAWFTDAVSGDSFVFHKPGGGYYTIRKECANPLGDLAALEAPDFSMTLTADRNGSPATLAQGDTASIGVHLKNNGPADSDPGVLEVKKPGEAVAPCGGNCNLTAPAMIDLTGGHGGAHGYRPATNTIPGQAGPNWYWDVKAMGDNATTNGTLRFTVSPTAPVGPMTFDVYFYKGDLAGAVRHVTVTFTVVSKRTPGVVGLGSDVHAGGGTCDGTLTNGLVKAAAGSSSLGQYVVSASAVNGINNFGTNNSKTSTALRVGAAGGYMQVCRPDLVSAAQAYQAAGIGFQTLPGGLIDVGTLNPAYDVYFINGAASLHGTVNRKITLVALNANLTIAGNITLDGASHPLREVPSLGIIAAKDILINGPVTRVDAYLFSNGTINTCADAVTACSTATLNINGFVMGKALSFNRLGPKDSPGTPVAEQVTLTAQIYLNPPRLFDASVDDLLLEGQGEKQPLF